MTQCLYIFIKDVFSCIQLEKKALESSDHCVWVPCLFFFPPLSHTHNSSFPPAVNLTPRAHTPTSFVVLL